MDPALALLRPFDRARNRLLKWGQPLTSRLAGSRERRVAFVGVSLVFVALAGSIVVPLWMLALTPILLGLPHLLADVRYTVVRSGLGLEPALWLAPALALVLVTLFDVSAAGYAAVAAVAVASRAPIHRRLIVIVLAGAMALWSVLDTYTPSLLLLHLHNLIGIGLWLAWRRRTSNHHIWVVGALVAGVVLICLLAPASRGLTEAFAEPPGFELGTQFEWLAPRLGSIVAIRLVILFAFLQSVHYSVWLRLVPEEDRDRRTPRTFRASYRALVDELGPFVVWGVGICTLALIGWAAFDLAAANHNYLRFARFHAYLELCLIAYLWLGRSGEVVATRTQ